MICTGPNRITAVQHYAGGAKYSDQSGAGGISAITGLSQSEIFVFFVVFSKIFKDFLLISIWETNSNVKDIFRYTCIYFTKMVRFKKFINLLFCDFVQCLQFTNVVSLLFARRLSSLTTLFLVVGPLH